MQASWVSSAALLAVGACSTAYVPTTPRRVHAGDVQASVEGLRGTKVAEVRVATANATGVTLKAARLGTADQPPCTSVRGLGVVAESGQTSADEHRPLRLRSDERIDVLLPAALDDFSRAGLTMDLSFEDGATGCVRFPLTAAGSEILWQGGRGWGGSGHLRIEWPIASAGGIGGGLTAEMRFTRPVQLGGEWRLSLALPFGWVGCRGACPDVDFHSDEKNAFITGIFYHVGAAASVARVVSAGRWTLLPAVGIRASVYLLGAFADYGGDRVATGVGPFVGLGLLPWRRPSPPGFRPAPTARSGFELTFGALGAYGRPPGGTVWLLGLGWTFIDGE